MKINLTYSKCTTNFIIVLSCIIMAYLSACHEDKYKGMKDAFTEYARNNFDDPNLIKEIVSIDSLDCVDTKEIKKTCEELQQWIDSLYSIDDDMTIVNIFKRCDKENINPSKFTDRCKVLIREVYNDLLQTQSNLLNQLTNEVNLFEELRSYPDTVLVIYNLKYREAVENTTVLKKITVITDSKMKCFEFGNTMEDINPFIMDFGNTYLKLSKSLREKLESLEARREKEEEIYHILFD